MVSQDLNPSSLNPESKPLIMVATLLLSVEIMNSVKGTFYGGRGDEDPSFHMLS